MENERDQGYTDDQIATDPDESDVGIPSEDDEAAATSESTVARAPSTKASTEAEVADADPLQAILDKYVPKRDYDHATRKITEQGQQLRSRDDQLQSAYDRIEALEQRLSQSQQPQQGTGFGFGQQRQPAAPGSDPTITELKQQYSLLRDAILELNDQQGNMTTRQMIQNRYGVSDARILDRYEQLKAEGREFEAHDLLRDARDAAMTTRNNARRTRQAGQSPILDGAGGAAPVNRRRAQPADERSRSKNPVDREQARRDKLRRGAGLD